MHAWLVVALVVAAFAVGFALGLLVGVIFAPREEDWGAVPDEDAPREPWDLRISPERYLARFPDGPHAQQARRHVT